MITHILHMRTYLIHTWTRHEYIRTTCVRLRRPTLLPPTHAHIDEDRYWPIFAHNVYICVYGKKHPRLCRRTRTLASIIISVDLERRCIARTFRSRPCFLQSIGASEQSKPTEWCGVCSLVRSKPTLFWNHSVRVYKYSQKSQPITSFTFQSRDDPLASIVSLCKTNIVDPCSNYHQ